MLSLVERYLGIFFSRGEMGAGSRMMKAAFVDTSSHGTPLVEFVRGLSVWIISHRSRLRWNLRKNIDTVMYVTLSLKSVACHFADWLRKCLKPLRRDAALMLGLVIATILTV